MTLCSYCKVFHFINKGEDRKTLNRISIVFIVSCDFDIVRFKMSFLRESVKKQSPSAKKVENRKDGPCKGKNEDILHILAPDLFYN